MNMEIRFEQALGDDVSLKLTTEIGTDWHFLVVDAKHAVDKLGLLDIVFSTSSIPFPAKEIKQRR